MIKSQQDRQLSDGLLLPQQEGYCTTWQYLNQNKQCQLCPKECETCFVENNQVKCRICAQTYYYNIETGICQKDCPEKTYKDDLKQECVECQVRYCLVCDQGPQQCSQCDVGFEYDFQQNKCLKDCQDQLFSEFQGQCKDSCDSDEIQTSNSCVNYIGCPNNQGIRNICSSINIKKIIPHPNGINLISIGDQKIFLYSIPNLVLQKEYTIQGSYFIVDCKIFLMDKEEYSMFCYNSLQHILQFSLPDFSLTLIREMRGFINNSDVENEVVMDSELIIATTQNIVEKFDFIKNEYSLFEIKGFDFDYIQSIVYWKSQDLFLINVYGLEVGSNNFLAIYPGFTHYQNLTFNQYSYLPQVIYVIKDNIIGISGISNLDICTLKSEKFLTFDDVTCTNYGNEFFEINFYPMIFDLLEDQQITVIKTFQPYDDYYSMVALDSSQGYDLLTTLITIQRYKSYTLVDRVLFIIDLYSHIQMIDLNGITSPINQDQMLTSIPIALTYEYKLLKILYWSNRIILANELEILTILINEEKYSSNNHDSNNDSQTTPVLPEKDGQKIIRILKDTSQIVLNESSKCSKYQNNRLIIDAFKEQGQDKTYSIIVHPFSIVFKNQFEQNDQNSFQYNLDRLNGQIQETNYYEKYRFLYILQVKTITLLDIKTFQPVLTLDVNGYEFELIKIKSDAKTFLITYVDNELGRLLLSFNFETLQTKQYIFEFYYCKSFLHPSSFTIQCDTEFIKEFDFEGNFLSSYSPLQSAYLKSYLGVSYRVSYMSRFHIYNVEVLEFLDNQYAFFSLPQQKIYKSGKLITPFKRQYNNYRNLVDFFFLYKGMINIIIPSKDNQIKLQQWGADGELVVLGYFDCQGKAQDLIFQEYFQDGEFAVVESLKESLLCIISLKKKTAQYIQKQSQVSTLMYSMTYLDSMNIQRVIFLFVFSGRSSVYQLFEQENDARILYKYLDLGVECKKVRQYDQNNMLCQNQEYQDAIFYPINNRIQSIQLKTNYQITNFITQDNYLIVYGENNIVVYYMEKSVFALQRVDEYNQMYIIQVFFNEKTLDLLIGYDTNLYEYFNLNRSGDELTTPIYSFYVPAYLFINFHVERFLMFGYDLVYSIFVAYDCRNKSQIISRKMLEGWIIHFATTFNDEYFFFATNSVIVSVHLQTFDFKSKQLAIDPKLMLYQLLLTQDKKTLILMQKASTKSVWIDANSLSVLSYLDLPINQKTNSTQPEQIYKFVGMRPEQNYIILDLNITSRIVVIDTFKYSISYSLQLSMQYKILDIDYDNQLICILSADNFIRVFNYLIPDEIISDQQSPTSLNSTSDQTTNSIHIPTYQISMIEYVDIAYGNLGQSFLQKVQGLVFYQYGIIITLFENNIRIMSLKNGSLLLLIKKQDTIVTSFQNKYEQYLITYGGYSLNIFNIEYSYFQDKKVYYEPFQHQAYLIPQFNDNLLIQSEIEIFQSKYSDESYFAKPNSSNDCSSSSMSYILNERTEKINTKIPIQINPTSLSKEQLRGEEKQYLDANSKVTEFHNMYYLTSANVLFGGLGSQGFKQIQLLTEPRQSLIDNNFFVTAQYVVYLQPNNILIYDLQLKLIEQVQILDSQKQIQKVYSVRPELNKFLYKNSNKQILFFDLNNYEQHLLFSITEDDHGDIDQYFVLKSWLSKEDGSLVIKEERVKVYYLVFIFKKGGILIVDLNTFNFYYHIQNSNSPIEEFQQSQKYFASGDSFYLNTINRQIMKIAYVFVPSYDVNKQLTSVQIMFDTPKIIVEKPVYQFFMDVSRKKLILFIEGASYIHYQIDEGQLISSSLMIPSLEKATLLIHKDLDIYLFFGEIYVMIVQQEQLKFSSIIQEKEIKGKITNVKVLTRKVFIIISDIGIYTVVIRYPGRTQSKSYFLANKIEINESTILFNRFLQPSNTQNLLYIYLEGVSQDGFFAFQYPVDLAQQTLSIQCQINFNYSNLLISTNDLINQVSMIRQMNSQSMQTYQTKIFQFNFLENIQQLNSFSNLSQFEFFIVQGQTQNLLFNIAPSTNFADLQIKNLQLKRLTFNFIKYAGADSSNYIKKFLNYQNLLISEGILLGANLGYQFFVQSTFNMSLVSVQFNKMVLTTYSNQQRRFLKQQKKNTRIIRQLEEEDKIIEDQIFEKHSFILIKYVDGKINFKQILINEMLSTDYQSIYTFKDSNQVQLKTLRINDLTIKNQIFDEQSFSTFISVNSVLIDDVTFNRTTLIETSLFYFKQVQNVEISNIIIQDLKCQSTLNGETNPPFLFSFLGVKNITMYNVTLINVHNCFLIKDYSYSSENILKKNLILSIQSFTLYNYTFNSIQALQNIQLSSNRNSLKSILSDQHLAPSLITIQANTLKIANMNLTLLHLQYNPLLNIESINTEMGKIYIIQANILIPDYYSSNPHAINIKSQTLDIQTMNLVSNSNVNIFIDSFQCVVNDLLAQNNTNYIRNSKSENFGLITISQANQLILQNSKFIKNSGTYLALGSLYLSFVSNFIIDQCQFIENISSKYQGGAITIANSDNTHNYIKFCEFQYNISPNHSGGAIYARNSDFNLENSLFKNNTSLIGGAIRFISNKNSNKFSKNYNKQNNTYIKNYALYYGKNVGLFPSRLIRAQGQGDVLDVQQKIFIDNFRSGDILEEIDFYLIDNDSQPINMDIDDIDNQHYDNEIKYEMKRIKFDWNLTDTTDIFIPYGDIFYNKIKKSISLRFNIYITPLKSKEIILQTTDTYQKISNDDSDIKKIQIVLSVSSRLCLQGEIYNQVYNIYECLPCPEGKYSYQLPDMSQPDKITCKICPAQAKSCQQNQVQLFNGYWRESEFSEEIYKCDKAYMNCQAENPKNLFLCGEGSVGPLCQSCDNYGRIWGKKYTKFTDGTCRDCKEMLASTFLLISLCVIIITYTLILVWQNCKAINRKIKALTLIKLGLIPMGRSAIFDHFTTISKILMNYVQFIFILSEMDVNIPSSIQFLQLGGDPIFNIVYSVDCLLNALSQMKIVYWRIFWILLFAAFLLVIISITFLIRYIRFRISIMNKKPTFDSFGLKDSPNTISKLQGSKEQQSKHLIVKSCILDNKEINSQNNLNNNEDKQSKSSHQILSQNQILPTVNQYKQIELKSNTQMNENFTTNNIQPNIIQTNSLLSQEFEENIKSNHLYEGKNGNNNFVVVTPKQLKTMQKSLYQSQGKNILSQSVAIMKSKRMTEGIDKSQFLHYFKNQSKYFQWYLGYIYMSIKLIFFYLQPGLFKQIIRVLSCVKIGTKLYILADPQFECDKEYQDLSLSIIMPILLIMGIIFPVWILYKLYKNRNNQDSFTFLKSYGFFFQEYKKSAYYWEILRIFQKMLVSCVLVFYNSYVQLKFILTIFIISLYIFLQLRYQPYKSKSFNQLDYYSNFVVIMSLLLGLLITSTDIFWLRLVSGFTVGVINCIFLFNLFKQLLVTITLPFDPSLRNWVHHLLFFLYSKIPILFGLITIRKSFTCKIFILWKKLSIYVHLHREILLQKSNQNNKDDYILSNSDYKHDGHLNECYDQQSNIKPAASYLIPETFNNIYISQQTNMASKNISNMLNHHQQNQDDIASENREDNSELVSCIAPISIHQSISLPKNTINEIIHQNTSYNLLQKKKKISIDNMNFELGNINNFTTQLSPTIDGRRDILSDLLQQNNFLSDKLFSQQDKKSINIEEHSFMSNTSIHKKLYSPRQQNQNKKMFEQQKPHLFEKNDETYNRINSLDVPSMNSNIKLTKNNSLRSNPTIEARQSSQKIPLNDKALKIQSTQDIDSQNNLNKQSSLQSQNKNSYIQEQIVKNRQKQVNFMATIGKSFEQNRTSQLKSIFRLESNPSTTNLELINTQNQNSSLIDITTQNNLKLTSKSQLSQGERKSSKYKGTITLNNQQNSSINENPINLINQQEINENEINVEQNNKNAQNMNNNTIIEDENQDSHESNSSNHSSNEDESIISEYNPTRNTQFKIKNPQEIFQQQQEQEDKNIQANLGQRQNNQITENNTQINKENTQLQSKEQQVQIENTPSQNACQFNFNNITKFIQQ